MKRLWAAIVLIVICGGVCAFNIYYLNMANKETLRYAERIVSQYKKGEYEAASFTANELENSWEKNEKVLCRFLSENKLENVRVIIAELPNLAEYENHEFSFYIKKLHAALEHITGKEKLSIY